MAAGFAGVYYGCLFFDSVEGICSIAIELDVGHVVLSTEGFAVFIS